MKLFSLLLHCRRVPHIRLSLETLVILQWKLNLLNPLVHSPQHQLCFRFSPPVEILKAPCTPTHYSTGHRSYKPKNGDAKVTIADTVTVQHTLGDQQDEPSTSTTQVQTPHMTVRPTHASHEPRLSSTSDAGEGHGNGCDCDVFAGSTMEDALTFPKKLLRGHFGETLSDTSCSSSPVQESGPGPLSSSSRALKKQHFSEASQVFHPRVTLLSYLIRVKLSVFSLQSRLRVPEAPLICSAVSSSGLAGLTWMGVLAAVNHVVPHRKTVFY